MAETQPKRLRGEPPSLDFEEANPCTKRQKPYNNILSLLEEEEEEQDETEPPNEDLSAMFTTLQQELSSSTSCESTAFDDFDFVPFTAVEVEVEVEVELEEELATHNQKSTESSTSAVCSPRSVEGEDEEAKSVMRHLLEASDDELGIPNREDNDVLGMKSGENFPFALRDHGLWELEDETANYYTVLQSELFM